MQTFLASAGVVALAEMGDRTQILTLVLAARYRRPAPIILGVLIATLANHAVAGGIGTWLASALNPSVLNWAVVVSFLLMAGWVLLPDRSREEPSVIPKKPMGVFTATLFAFFIAEIGDKTQLATVALAARFQDFIGVVSGTTLGMVVANIPVIYLGHRFADRLPVKAVHVVAALVFVLLGALALRNALAGVPIGS
jgi:Ca2+/H+ antiporter, TMEM165/GDT1 family